MIFIFKKWKDFCRLLYEKNIISATARSLKNNQNQFLVLKHDVETNVKKAYKMAKIEKEFGHCGSYYVQAYLLGDKKNISLLEKMKKMGHEISYHYDVMDSSKGDIEKAIIEFSRNKEIFENNGFDIETVCQHGNPLIERIGYTSNRDFFRNKTIQELYPTISDIMVNFKSSRCIDYLYFSDAGRVFKLVFDPLNNDIVKSDDKDIPYDNLAELNKVLKSDGCYIISTHPHRWCSSFLAYLIKNVFFKLAKITAKTLYKIPFMKKLMNKYYYLAKKI